MNCLLDNYSELLSESLRQNLELSYESCNWFVHSKRQTKHAMLLHDVTQLRQNYGSSNLEPTQGFLVAIVFDKTLRVFQLVFIRETPKIEE